MKNINLVKFVNCFLVLSLSVTAAFAQKQTKPAAKPKPFVFAVLNDGQTLEPIGEIDKGELVETTNGGSEPKELKQFIGSYYKPNTKYNLIFGSKSNGTITVKSSSPESDCAKNQATATTQTTRTKLKGFVMALATNAPAEKSASGVRRLPTVAERAEIELLVRTEFIKQSVSSNAAKKLNFHNLTALDVNNDGKAEIVGSSWVDTSAKEKNLLFFIAEMDGGGKYNFGYSSYSKVTPDDLMSGADMKVLDEGIGNELLLDSLEYNGDTSAEIFTVTQSFEGNNFSAYSKIDGKWTQVFKGYNYHCAF